MPIISDATAISIKLGWLITVVVLLMGLASSSGVLVYQVGELRAEVRTLAAQRTADREALISLTSTLQGQGVLK